MRFVTLLALSVIYIYAEEVNINADAVTNAHNELRKKHGLDPLVYEKSLEEKAQKWAKKLHDDGCKMAHSHGDTGENLFWASAYSSAAARDERGAWIWHRSVQRVDEREVVQAWYDEVQWYDYEKNSCQEGKVCGHYTQVVWHTTTEVGCAATVCEDFSQIWVCEYAPAGNVVGKRPY